MRIGTWNVEYGFGVRNPNRLALLKSHPADIWVLTETHHDLDLSETHIPVCSTPRPFRCEGSTWVTVWSRYPLIQRLTVPDPCRMVAALFDIPGGPLAVAGVVLPWHSDKGDRPADPPPKNWSEHRRVLREQLPPLLQELRVGARRVLAGDFNTDLARPHAYGVVDG